MRTHREDEFLEWAERSGFQIDPRYPHSAVLTFRPDPGYDRFWEVPSEPERRPYFIASLLDCMAVVDRPRIAARIDGGADGAVRRGKRTGRTADRVGQ